MSAPAKQKDKAYYAFYKAVRYFYVKFVIMF